MHPRCVAHAIDAIAVFCTQLGLCMRIADGANPCLKTTVNLLCDARMSLFQGWMTACGDIVCMLLLHPHIGPFIEAVDPQTVAGYGYELLAMSRAYDTCQTDVSKYRSGSSSPVRQAPHLTSASLSLVFLANSNIVKRPMDMTIIRQKTFGGRNAQRYALHK